MHSCVFVCIHDHVLYMYLSIIHYTVFVLPKAFTEAFLEMLPEKRHLRVGRLRTEDTRETR